MMSTVPTIVVHGGAGTYASIADGHESKESIENGKCFKCLVTTEIRHATVGKEICLKMISPSPSPLLAHFPIFSL